MAGNPTRIPNAKVGVLQDDNTFSLPWRLWAANLTGAQDPGVLTINNLSGDVTLAAGANINITVGGNTLTISSPDPDQTGFVTVSGYPAAGQNTVWAGGSSITGGPARTPWTDHYGFNYATTLGNDTTAAFADTSTITGFTAGKFYTAFLCGYNFTGAATGASGQQLIGGQFLPTFGGTGTLDSMYGLNTSVSVEGTVTKAIGNYLLTYVLNGALTTGYGFQATSNISIGGSITTYYAFEDAADMGSAAGTSWGYHQTATNHPNKFASTSEFVLYTQHDYLAAFEVVGTDTNKRLVSIANSTAGFVLTSNGPGVIPTFQASGGGGGNTWLPLVDGHEPPGFITDGAGALITVAYAP